MPGSVEVNFEARGFAKQVRTLQAEMDISLAAATAQFAGVVAGRAYDRLPPSDVSLEQQRLEAYLSARPAIGGGQRVHAIIQERRRRRGLPGLGPRQLAKSGRAFKRRAVRSVGYVKSALVPIVRQLNRILPEPIRLAGARLLPEPSGSFEVRIGRGSDGPSAGFAIQLEVSPGQEARVQRMIENAIADGVRDSEKEAASSMEARVGQAFGRAR